jgi:hypothetical protein
MQALNRFAIYVWTASPTGKMPPQVAFNVGAGSGCPQYGLLVDVSGHLIQATPAEVDGRAMIL